MPNYTITETKCLESLTLFLSSEINCIVGETYYVDGIETLCIKEGSAYSINNNILSFRHSGEKPIFVDKNHDFCYFTRMNDYLESQDYDSLPEGTFSFDWGLNTTVTGITSEGINYGWNNSNALIAQKLTPNGERWLVWDKLEEFRKIYSNKWFVPSKEELGLIWTYRTSLNNLTYSAGSMSNYWSSSAYEGTEEDQYGSQILAWAITMGINEGPSYFATTRSGALLRVRLCATV